MCASLKAKFDSKQHNSFHWFNVSSIISSSPDGPGSASASDQRSRAFVLQSRPRCPQHGVRHERLLRVQTTIRRAWDQALSALHRFYGDVPRIAHYISEDATDLLRQALVIRTTELKATTFLSYIQQCNISDSIFCVCSSEPDLVAEIHGAFSYPKVSADVRLIALTYLKRQSSTSLRAVVHRARQLSYAPGAA